jgi:general nucleoside transport system ATP-binding protein
MNMLHRIDKADVQRVPLELAAPSVTPALELRGVTKRYGAVTALEDVSLSVRAGSVHCVLGENGAGKSTLCGIVFGTKTPDAGEVRVDGQILEARGPADALARGIAMVHQHFSLVGTLTVAENLALGGLRRRRGVREAAQRLRELGDRYDLHVDPDAIVEELSVGERQRVEILKALSSEPHLLVLDEPTAVLPPVEVASLLQLCRRIADDGRAVVLVTHKLAEVRAVAERATVLRGGRSVATVDLDSVDDDELVRLMVGRDVGATGGAVAAALGLTAGSGPRPVQAAATAFAGPAAISISGLSLDVSGGASILDEISIEVRPGEVVGIAGVEGNGQSELARILAGAQEPTRGEQQLAGKDVTGLRPRERARLGLAVIPEDRHLEACIDGLSIAENLVLGDLPDFSRFGLLRRGAIAARAKELMAEWDVRAPGPLVAMKTLSGGNQQRVVLARELSRDPLIAVLAAQPTRGLDVGAVVGVLTRLRAAAATGAGVLIISSELPELLATCHRIAVIHRGRIVGEVLPSEPGALERIGTLMSGGKVCS